jgi:hypothetical protein
MTLVIYEDEFGGEIGNPILLISRPRRAELAG